MKISINPLFLLVFAAIFFASIVPFQSFANSSEETNTAKTKNGQNAGKFNAGELIMEHIGDSHDWHLWGKGEHAVSIPLPVILYTAKGFDVFMSSDFHHGEKTVSRKNIYKLEENHIKIVNEAGEIDEVASKKLVDISITKNVVALFFSAFLMMYIFLSVASTYKKNPSQAPKGIQSALEPIIIFIRDDIAKSAIGPKKYEKFMPFLLTVFFFIWFNNMLGIIPIFPAGANLTGNIAITGFLALVTFIITSINGNKNYWHHIFAMPGVPKPVLLILTPIEIMGVFLRPFVLMIRLFANMLAGHIIQLSFFCLIFIFAQMSTGAGYGISILSVLFNVFMGLLEVLVALIQAYVFTLLSASYFGAAIEEAHQDKESII